MPVHDLATITADQFESWLNQEFRLAEAGGTVLRLAEVHRPGHGARPGGDFSLIFNAPNGPSLPQAIYAMEHPGLGRQEIFLVPIGPQGDENAYEAVFS